MLALLVFLTSLKVSGSSCDSLVFLSQDEVNLFPTLGCDSITGALIIKGFGITNLDSLIGLRYIHEDLLIDSTSITNLEGLDSLVFVRGRVILQYCFNLEDLSSFSHISFTQQLHILGCSSLDSIVMNSFAEIDGIFIEDNEEVTYLSIANNALVNNIYTDYLSIINMVSLDSVKVFANATQMGGMGIQDNPQLRVIDPFTDLAYVNGIYFSNNDRFKQFNFLPDLVFQRGQFVLLLNDSLTLIDLPKIRQIKELIMEYNPLLNDCCFITGDIVFGNTSLHINSNGNNCSDVGVIFNICELNDPDGDEIFMNEDNCPNVSNPNQSDFDNDGIGNLCDNCPTIVNSNQLDSNENGIGDICEPSNQSKIGLHTSNPLTGVHIESSDLYIGDSQRGLIMRNFLGECFRISVNEFGDLTVIPISCPN